MAEFSTSPTSTVLEHQLCTKSSLAVGPLGLFPTTYTVFPTLVSAHVMFAYNVYGHVCCGSKPSRLLTTSEEMLAEWCLPSLVEMARAEPQSGCNHVL